MQNFASKTFCNLIWTLSQQLKKDRNL